GGEYVARRRERVAGWAEEAGGRIENFGGVGNGIREAEDASCVYARAATSDQHTAVREQRGRVQEARTVHRPVRQRERARCGIVNLRCISYSSRGSGRRVDSPGKQHAPVSQPGRSVAPSRVVHAAGRGEGAGRGGVEQSRTEREARARDTRVTAASTGH